MHDRPRLGRRTFHGVAYGPSVALGARSSLLVVGPTQGGKTSSLVTPAILRWRDALVVTSVKRDVLDVTRAWRESLGVVTVLEPGRDGGLTWDPLEGVVSYREALRVARDLTHAASTHGDTEFWNALAVKFVAALMVLARGSGRDIFALARVVDRREFEPWLVGATPGTARDVLDGFLDRDPKTLDGVLTTAETMLLPWRFEQPLAVLGDFVEGPNTLYLCSPRGEQRHYEPLLRGALRAVLERQQVLVDRGEQRQLLMVLDEAATVAPLEDLDQLAATVAGLDVTLVTVVQDFSQLSARWGARAATIVNNHTTRLVLGGLSDPTAGTFLPELVEPVNGRAPRALRRRPPGTATVISGREALFTVRLRPWWRERHLARRGAPRG